MKKRLLFKIAAVLFVFSLALITPKNDTVAKTYKFTGTYVGQNLYTGEFTRIVLKSNKTFKVYISGKLSYKGKVKRRSGNTYQASESYIRMKLASKSLKVYSSDGRDAKIPYSGSFKKIGQYKAKKLTTAQYNAVKGWWSHNSSGGYDVKFTKDGKVKYYQRYTNTVANTFVVVKVKKVKGNYLYCLYDNNSGSKISYYKQAGYMEFYGGWTVGKDYSGSSSLSVGRWQ